MRVAVVQSNYIPWKGYFDLIASVDHFILFDDAQYTRRDWRNRNKIKTPQGLQWLTVPVSTKSKYFQAIKDTRIDGDEWANKHWISIARNYTRTKFFDATEELFAPVYKGKIPEFLTDLNQTLIRDICGFLKIDTVVESSANYELIEGRNERLLDLCKKLKADVYVSGPSAQGYLDTEEFLKNGIDVEFFDYSGYPTYDQPWGEFEHNVSIVDLISNTGPDAPNFMKFL